MVADYACLMRCETEAFKQAATLSKSFSVDVRKQPNPQGLYHQQKIGH